MVFSKQIWPDVLQHAKMLFNKQRGNGEEKEERQTKFEQKNRLLTGEDKDLYSEVQTEGKRRRRRARGAEERRFQTSDCSETLSVRRNWDSKWREGGERVWGERERQSVATLARNQKKWRAEAKLGFWNFWVPSQINFRGNIFGQPGPGFLDPDLTRF